MANETTTNRLLSVIDKNELALLKEQQLEDDKHDAMQRLGDMEFQDLLAYRRKDHECSSK